MHINSAVRSPLVTQLRVAEQALAESQALIARVLPAFVIERLKAKPEAPIADRFENASVLFADIRALSPSPASWAAGARSSCSTG